MSGRGRDLAVVQRCGRLEQPIERLAQLTLGPRPRCGEVTAHVVDRAREHVQVISEGIDFGASNDEIGLADRQLTCPLARDPVPLPAGLAAELTPPPRLRGWGQYAPAPSATRQALPCRPVPKSVPFRHDETIPIPVVPGFDRLSGRSVGSQRSRQTPPGRAARWQCHVARRKRRRPARSGVRECRRDYRTVRRRRH